MEELPALTDNGPFDADLLARMRRVALREFGVHAQMAAEIHSEGASESPSEDQ
ncbi:hypothetical protein [Agrobacterium tumefaciens]|uniref:hypothetical protein n=1 Tax=Agrobacterium tumefaciens TaxID=358 RepID=UPI0015725780|nr:hypothetical protein [Agrobacterium tumefaciens]NTD86743.1 hypothetical protein [Agrobacterium tumefaciens]NTD91470.1 hypothetical protein [Agrobacterium tumefaciens]NTD96941.1 hypothetical protein [Agrobacterium tumefaciens]NTE11842.1 hypothetical protein [Agrobacterium tumefaciens]NTE24740.1 hypothetical protein [Agrobacterium tumefaciens]